jgi:hypothetical protein
MNTQSLSAIIYQLQYHKSDIRGGLWDSLTIPQRLRICFYKRNVMKTFTTYCRRRKKLNLEFSGYETGLCFRNHSYHYCFISHIFRQHNINDWRVQYNFPAIRLTQTNDPASQSIHPHAVDFGQGLYDF